MIAKVHKTQAIRRGAADEVGLKGWMTFDPRPGISRRRSRRGVQSCAAATRQRLRLLGAPNCPLPREIVDRRSCPQQQRPTCSAAGPRPRTSEPSHDRRHPASRAPAQVRSSISGAGDENQIVRMHRELSSARLTGTLPQIRLGRPTLLKCPSQYGARMESDAFLMKMIPIANSYRLVENLPNAVLLVYPDCGRLAKSR